MISGSVFFYLKMRIIFVFTLAVAGALAAPGKLQDKADACNPDACKLPDCRCAGTDIPGGLEASQTPQFVLLTFDDAVRIDNWQIYSDTFYDKKNPDGCNISTTYYVSHEYTDYSKINDLYQHGHEISLHSISHSASTAYWQNLSVEVLRQEFVDEISLISHFANIPKESIYGLRMPFLQLSGDNSFAMLKEAGLLYDSSWPTLTHREPGLWPYTLDYLSGQDCPVGPCPTSSLPGVWVAPMIDWTGPDGAVCAMVDGCTNIPEGDEDALLEWFKTNFHQQYDGNRAPFGFYVHSAWFLVEDTHLPAYKKFVDYLVGLEDVYIVTPSQVVSWVKNPLPLGSDDWPKCVEREATTCKAQACRLIKEETEERYMTVCGECPSVYPWLGNPLGQ